MTLGEPEVLAFDVVGTPIGFETGMLGHLRGACGDAAARLTDDEILTACRHARARPC
jgi:putative hydrolase of the HAD superfamily